MSKVIIVSNMKGGAGKSSVTMLISIWLHRIKNKKVLVIDADTLQQTIVDDRNNSLATGIKEEDLYKVMSSNPISANELIDYVLDDYDYIFIDIPGNLMEDGVIDLFTKATKFIIPMKCSLKDENATGKFLGYFSELVIPELEAKGVEPDIKGMFYMVNKKGLQYKNFKKRVEDGEIPIEFFKSVIPFSEVLERENDTVNPSEYINSNFDMNDLYKELETFLEV